MLELSLKSKSNGNTPKQILTEQIIESKLNLRKRKLFTVLSTKRLQSTQIEEIDVPNRSIASVIIQSNTSVNNNLMRLLDTNIEESLLQGLIVLRNTISVSNNPPIKEVFSESLAIKLIHLTDEYKNNKQILLETLWIITNFSYGDSSYTKVFYENGLINRLTILINNDPFISYSIIDQLAWLIANFSVDSIEYKKAFYENKFLEFFTKALEDWNIPIPVKENVLRAVSNIIQGISIFSQSKAKFRLIQLTQSIIRNIVIFNYSQLSDGKFKYLKYSIQIIFHLSENQEYIISLLFKNDFFKYLLAVLKDAKDDSIVSLIVYFLNSLCVLDNDSFIQNLLQLNLFDILGLVLRNKCYSNREIVKLICQFLTNLANVSIDYLNCIIQSDDLLFILLTLAKDSKFEIDQMNSNAFEVVATLLDTNSKRLIRFLIEKGVIDLIIKYSFQQNNKVEFDALKALYHLLEYFSDNVTKRKCLIIQLDNSGLSDKLRDNMLSTNNFIADISEQILYDFYPMKDENMNRSMSFFDESSSESL